MSGILAVWGDCKPSRRRNTQNKPHRSVGGYSCWYQPLVLGGNYYFLSCQFWWRVHKWVWEESKGHTILIWTQHCQSQWKMAPSLRHVPFEISGYTGGFCFSRITSWSLAHIQGHFWMSKKSWKVWIASQKTRFSVLLTWKKIVSLWDK